MTFSQQPVKLGTVIMAFQMAELMGNDVVDAFPWGTNQVGIEGQNTAPGKAAPTFFIRLTCSRGIVSFIFRNSPSKS